MKSSFATFCPVRRRVSMLVCVPMNLAIRMAVLMAMTFALVAVLMLVALLMGGNVPIDKHNRRHDYSSVA